MNDLPFCQIAIFENGFPDDAVLSDCIDDRAHLFLYIIPIAVFYPAEIHDIINLICPVGYGIFHFKIFNLDRGQTGLPLVGFLGGSFVGVIDDSINIFGNGRGAAGLRGPVKFFLITTVGLVLGWFFAYKLGWTNLLIPFMGNIEIGAFGMTIIFAFAVVATSNAVNITDGLDGLSGGLAMLAYGAFGIIALFQGNVLLFGFCMTLVGWLLSYIWFNVPPARFMMGDTGSFALGAGLGVVAMMTNSFLLLPVIGLPFVVETGSSLIQLASKKFFKKKIFISAPLHHHLEAKGWGEAKIVMRFWIIAGVCAILGIFLAATGGAI